ncbi:MAG TPA: PLP-dependent aminotransferase family protein [Jatrophihabitantaceae bacterium]|nr:PLP-dependent aminotransferase family protein [Jatrophihabitantaceae bacterium]
MAPVSRVSGRALAALLPDLHTLPGPVYAALSDSVTALVLDGRIATETRLPSERELAVALHVSRATVTAAYDELREQRFLTSRTGSGSFVTVPPGARPRPSLARWNVSPAVDDVIDLSCAALPAPPGIVERAVAAAADHIPALAADDGYDPAGLPGLRQLIADRYEARGVPTSPEQVIVTNGALHAWDLLLRLMIGPGDRVVTDLPTYPGALDAIRGNGARVLPVPMAADGGWQAEQLQATLRQTAPRLAYLIPDFHNPTGALMDEATRRDILRVARQTGTTVVVDESFVDLGFVAGERATAALDSSVISIGSLSKPVWGGLRTGWIRASSPDLAHRLAALRATIDMSGPVLDQLIAAEVFGWLDEITELRLAELRPQRDALVAAIARELPQWTVAVPQGGLSVWIELDAPMSTPLTLLAGQAGVAVVPGSRFGIDGTLERFLRLPFSLSPERLDDAVRRLATVWAQLDKSGASSRQLVVA